MGNRFRQVGVSRSAKVSAFLMIWLIIFPKAGFKTGGIPFTFGYIFFAVVVICSIVLNVASGKLLILTKARVIILPVILCFPVFALLSFWANGYEDLGFATALIINLFLIPLAAIYFLSIQLDRLNYNVIFKSMRLAIFVVSVIGLAMFVYRDFTGNNFEIPYLTFNSGDIGTFGDKFNDRGGVYKLTSTYNNGNIYGVSLLLLLPLFCYLENSVWKKATVKMSLVLTLSRTVWIGLILYQIFLLRRLSASNLVYSLIGIIGLFILIYFSMSFMHRGSAFLFDPNLGGRAAELNVKVHWFANKPFSALKEIVPISVLDQFGVVGLVAFLLEMWSPLIVLFMGWVPESKSAYKRSLTMGLVIYSIIMFSDGAIDFIPVMMFYWFMVALLLTPTNGRLRRCSRFSYERPTEILILSRGQSKAHADRG